MKGIYLNHMILGKTEKFAR